MMAAHTALMVSMLMLAGVKADDSQGFLSKFITPNLKHMQSGAGPDALSYRADALGQDFNAPKIVSKEEEKAAQSNMPSSISAVSFALVSLAAMVGLSLGALVPLPSRWRGLESDMSVPMAPNSEGSAMELETRGSATNYRRVGWGQMSSQNLRPVPTIAFADASGMDGIQAPVGFFDPLGLAENASEETLNWYRAAEIKHGRVAMAAFLGCCVNGAGIEFPGNIDLAGDTFRAAGSTRLPLETWDAIPASGRIQLIVAVGGIEWVFESQEPHYLRGGKPGFVRLTPGTAPWHASGYDPMGKYDAETRKKKRNMELANGRLAMLGMAAFVAAEKIPGSVPILTKIGFAGDYAGTMPGNPLPSSMVM